MSKDPAFLFYSSDFLSGCIDLEMEERGQYITMLCAQHQKGHLSEKTIRLLVGSVSVSVLDKFTKDESGNYFSARLDEEIEKRKKFTESRKLNGQKGGRKPNAIPLDKPLALPKKNHTENEIENENNNEFKNVEGKIEALIFTSLGELYIESIRDQWKAIDFNSELESFKQKVRGSPDEYVNRESLRTAFQYQLRNAKKINKEPTGFRKKSFELKDI